MGLRDRRLGADWDSVRELAGEGSRIRILETEGEPPERYRLELHVAGLVVSHGSVQPLSRHQVEVYLTTAYPRQAPQCRMLTPVFHPNIAPHAICVGDHWSAGESLGSLIIRIAEMICYQSYNVKSPLNGDAARWAEEHSHELPLESHDFGLLLEDGEPGVPPGEPEEPPVEVETVVSEPVVPTVGWEPGEERTASVDPPGREDAPRRTATITSGSEGACPHCGAAFYRTPGAAGWIRCPMCRRMITGQDG